MHEVVDGDTDIWRFHDLDQALTCSREVGEPVFAYWSTPWCPPCAEMQATVLRRPEFRARCDAMVTLAVDGDAPGAQNWGDRLVTDVYPTMLVLDGDAQEWIRFSGGLTSQTFCDVLDVALRKRTAISQLAETVVGQRSPIDDEDLRLLAFHYWPQDRRVYPGAARLALLEALDAQAAARRSRDGGRILVWRIIECSQQHASKPPPIPAQVRERLYERFIALLLSGEATYATLYYVMTGLDPVVHFLCEEDAARRRGLSAALLRVLEGLVADEGLSWTERLIARSAQIKVTNDEAGPSEGDAEPHGAEGEMVEQTRVLVARAEASVVSSIERQSVINMAGHLLRQSGLREASIDLFRTQIERSPWPTYFMPYVAEMYMEAKDKDEAFRWWLRSYEETRGKNTRFELGVRYVAALVRHAPQDRAAIEAMVTRLFSDFGDAADMARGRIRNSLGLLSRTLGTWRAAL